MADNFYNLLGRYRSWSTTTSVPNNKVVILELYGNKCLNHYPFMFIHSWLYEAYFCKMIKENWIEFSNSVHMPPMIGFLKKTISLGK